MTSRTLDPKVLEGLYVLMEQAAEHAYRLGQQDQIAGKSLKTEDFKLSKANRLVIKTNLIKTLEKR